MEENKKPLTAEEILTLELPSMTIVKLFYCGGLHDDQGCIIRAMKIYAGQQVELEREKHRQELSQKALTKERLWDIYKQHGTVIHDANGTPITAVTTIRFAKMIDSLSGLIPAEESKWISVDDRLPDRFDKCLFVVKSTDPNYDGQVYVGTYTGDPTNNRSYNEFSLPGITFGASDWQPLLQSPPNTK